MIYKSLSLLLLFIHFLFEYQSNAQCACDHLTTTQLRFKAVIQQADIDGMDVPKDLLAFEAELEKRCGRANSVFNVLVKNYQPVLQMNQSKPTKMIDILEGMLESIEESKDCVQVFDADGSLTGEMCPTVVFKSLLDELAMVISYCYLSEVEDAQLVSMRN